MEVIIEAPGIEPHRKTVKRPAQQESVRFDLESPRRVNGKIVTPRGQPVSDMQVQFFRTDGYQVLTTSTQQGAYACKILPGDYRVQLIGNERFAVDSEMVDLEVPDNENPAEMRCEAIPAIKISGVVLDENRNPVAKAKVVVSSSQASATTDETGKFTIGGINPKGANWIFASEPQSEQNGRLLLEEPDPAKEYEIVFGEGFGTATLLGTKIIPN